MHDLERKRAVVGYSSTCEDLIASMVKDFRDLGEIFSRLNAERLNLDRRQLDCLVRANEATERGIELTSRLSRN